MRLFCRTIESGNVIRQIPIEEQLVNNSKAFVKMVEASFLDPTPILLVETVRKGIPILMAARANFNESVNTEALWSRADVRANCVDLDTAFRSLQIIYKLMCDDSTSQIARSVLVISAIKTLNFIMEWESSTAILSVAGNKIVDIGLVVPDETSDFVTKVSDQFNSIFKTKSL